MFQDRFNHASLIDGARLAKASVQRYAHCNVAQLDALQERLRNVIRVTDACSNYSRDGLLMLLPMTDIKQIKPVHAKLLELQHKQAGTALELCIKVVSLPANIGDNVADWLTDELVKATPLT